MRAIRGFVSGATVSLFLGMLSSPAAAAVDCAIWTGAFNSWRQNMDTYGRQLGAYIGPNSGRSSDEKLAAIYYDSQWVFQQIGEYLGQTQPWQGFGETAETIYRGYLDSASWRAQGYRRFPHGFYGDFVRGQGTTQQDLVRLRDNPVLSSLADYTGGYAGFYQSMSREVAYALQANVYAERAGAARKLEGGSARVNTFVQWMKQHFKEWQSGQFATGSEDGERFAPFMAALSIHSLSEFAVWEKENGRDINTVWGGDWIADMSSFLQWAQGQSTVRQGPLSGQRMWMEPQRDTAAFRYEDRGSGTGVEDPAWDLDMLIAYAYVYVGNAVGQKGDTTTAGKLIDMADKLFIGGARNGYLDGGKQFSQAYRLSIQYVKLREAASTYSPSCSVPRPLAPTAFTVR